MMINGIYLASRVTRTGHCPRATTGRAKLRSTSIRASDTNVTTKTSCSLLNNYKQNRKELSPSFQTFNWPHKIRHERTRAMLFMIVVTFYPNSRLIRFFRWILCRRSHFNAQSLLCWFLFVVVMHIQRWRKTRKKTWNNWLASQRVSWWQKINRSNRMACEEKYGYFLMGH